MIFTEREAQESWDYFFNSLIPRIQRHVNETGHIWNLCTTCHECLSVRQAYQSNRYFLEAHEMEKQGQNFDEIVAFISKREEYNLEFCQRLSD